MGFASIWREGWVLGRRMGEMGGMRVMFGRWCDDVGSGGGASVLWMERG